MGRLLALIAALIVGALIAWAGERTPAPRPSSAPTTAFSAERALADIRGFASVPHPVGSDANRAARDYLLARLSALRLSPRVQSGAGIYSQKFASTDIDGGFVQNLVGVLPGRDRSLPALALMAHYDSVPASSGASDDAAGTSSMLEIARAIEARGTPARDVIILITDGEESGLLGANAFFRADPQAKRIGAVINADPRGSAGQVVMFQTGERSGEWIDLLKRTAPRTTASSMIDFIYAIMHNDTDFTVPRQTGLSGFNYGFVAGQFDYHSPTSTPAAQDLGTLQQLGDAILPMATALAFSPTLPRPAESPVYSNVPGGWLIAYPPAAGWLILAAAAALIAWGAVRARRKEPFAWLDLARGAGAAVFAVATGAAVMNCARVLTGAQFGYFQQRFLLAQVSRWEAAVMLLVVGSALLAAAQAARGKRWLVALLPLAAGGLAYVLNPSHPAPLVEGGVGALAALAAYGRAASRPGAWTGVLVLGLVLALALQAVAPAAAFAIAWPLAWAALASALTAAGAHKSAPPLLALAAFAAVGVAFAGAFAHTGFLALDQAELLCLPLFTGALVVWPLAQTEEGAPPARLLGPGLILAGFAVTLAVRFNDPYDARHPDITNVVYEVDQDAHKAWRTSRAPALNAWARAALTTDGGRVAKRTTRSGRVYDAAEAAYIDLPAPQIALAKRPDGDLVLHVAPPLDARVVDLTLRSNTVTTVTGVGGAPLRQPMKPGADVRLRWEAAQPGFDVTLHAGGPGKLEVAYFVTVERWPAAAKPLPPRPKNVMPFDLSDSTVLEGVRSFSW